MDATVKSGFLRMVRSAKVQTSLTGLAGAWGVIHYEGAGLPPTQHTVLLVAFVGAATTLLREIVNAWSNEDVARLQNQSPAPTPLPDETATTVSKPLAMPTATKPATVAPRVATKPEYRPTFPSPQPGAKPGAK